RASLGVAARRIVEIEHDEEIASPDHRAEIGDLVPANVVLAHRRANVEAGRRKTQIVAARVEMPNRISGQRAEDGGDDPSVRIAGHADDEAEECEEAADDAEENPLRATRIERDLL